MGIGLECLAPNHFTLNSTEKEEQVPDEFRANDSINEDNSDSLNY